MLAGTKHLNNLGASLSLSLTRAEVPDDVHRRRHRRPRGRFDRQPRHCELPRGRARRVESVAGAQVAGSGRGGAEEEEGAGKGSGEDRCCCCCCFQDQEQVAQAGGVLKISLVFEPAARRSDCIKRQFVSRGERKGAAIYDSERGYLSTTLSGETTCTIPFRARDRLSPVLRGKVGQRVSLGVERVPVQRDHVSVREQQVQVLERFRLGRGGGPIISTS
jgi:hypothetical protein